MRIIAYKTLINNGKVQLLESTGEATKFTDDFYELLGTLVNYYYKLHSIYVYTGSNFS